MYKNLREYTDFLVGIGKRYCAESEVEDSLKLSSVQQEIMTGFMLKEDLIAAKKIQLPIEMMPDILMRFSLYLVDNEKGMLGFLDFIKEEAVSYYWFHCQAYLDAIWILEKTNEK